MIQVVYSPQWFFGKDIIIDIVSIIVLGLIAFTSFRFYRINRKKRSYFALAISFFILALAFLSKILTNFTIYYHVLETRQIGFVTLTYQTLRSTNTLFFIGFLLYRLLTLFGLYILYSIHHKQSKSSIFLTAYLILISTYFSQSAYYIFHITSLILLAFITKQFLGNYLQNKSANALLVFLSFLVIALSNLLFTFIKINTMFYVIAEITQLIGYIALLIAFIMVLKHGKKKKQT